MTDREVIRLLFEADCYPRIGNEDWQIAEHMEAEALAAAGTALPSPDDPPEFARWIKELTRADLSAEAREEIYFEMHDYFGDPAAGKNAK